MEEDNKDNKKPENEDKAKVGESEDTGDGDKHKTPQSIVDANAAAKRLEEANKKHAENLDRQEDMITRKILAGGTEAGQTTEKPKEETPEEYARKIYPSGFNKPAPPQDVKR